MSSKIDSSIKLATGEIGFLTPADEWTTGAIGVHTLPWDNTDYKGGILMISVYEDNDASEQAEAHYWYSFSFSAASSSFDSDLIKSSGDAIGTAFTIDYSTTLRINVSGLRSGTNPIATFKTAIIGMAWSLT